jgi:hypothetical protein
MIDGLSPMLAGDRTSASATRLERQYPTRPRPIGTQSDDIRMAAVAKRCRVARRTIQGQNQPCGRGPHGESRFIVVASSATPRSEFGRPTPSRGSLCDRSRRGNIILRYSCVKTMPMSSGGAVGYRRAAERTRRWHALAANTATSHLDPLGAIPPPLRYSRGL